MIRLFKKQKMNLNLFAPVNGICIPLNKVNDPVFASHMMGDGIAFQPSSDIVYSPIDGKITVIAKTKHAIGIKADNGAEILIHVGLDTVQLHGEGFQILVEIQEKVKKGTPLLKFNRYCLEKKGIDLTTCMIVTNSGDMDIKELSETDSVIATQTAVLCVKNK